MQELEKILEEIEQRVNYYKEHATLEYVDICAGLREAEGIIRNHMNDGWIPAGEKPTEDGFYVATMSGELVGRKEQFVGLAEFEDENWVDGDVVIAWRPLPEAYLPERNG